MSVGAFKREIEWRRRQTEKEVENMQRERRQIVAVGAFKREIEWRSCQTV